jgi:hypothetical protein
MIAKALSTLSELLNDRLKRTFRLDEGIVSLQPITSALQSLPTNKIHLLLINIDRETAGGINFSRQAISDEHFKKTAPAWQLNVYLLFAVVFSEKRYEEGLQFLSAIATFLQSNNYFTLPQSDIHIGIEPVNLSFNELSNLWSICGGQYYPSFLCKLRNVIIDSNEIQEIGTLIKKKGEQFDRV